MIHNIEENGPYIVLSDGFAVPHEGLEQGSVKVGMNLIRLKHPVHFGADDFDPVEFVCCLSAVDHKMHLKAFFNLVNMLRNEEFKEALKTCIFINLIKMVEMISQSCEVISTVLFSCKIFAISLTVFIYSLMVRYVCKEKHW